MLKRTLEQCHKLMNYQERQVFDDVYIYGRDAAHSLYEEKWRLKSRINEYQEDLSYLHDLLDGNLEERKQYYLHLEEDDEYKDAEDWLLDYVREEEEIREFNFGGYTKELALEVITDTEECLNSCQDQLKKYPRNLNGKAESIRKKAIKKIAHLLPANFDETKSFNDIETICCVCGKPFQGLGNDPWPLKALGECCDDCYERKIAIPDYDFVYPRDLSKEEDEHFVYVFNLAWRLYGHVTSSFFERLWYHIITQWGDRISKPSFPVRREPEDYVRYDVYFGPDHSFDIEEIDDEDLLILDEEDLDEINPAF